jgi:hypothetical protein
MSETIKFAKVNTLPGTFVGSTIYLVKDVNGDFAEMYISNQAGSAVRRLPSRSDIQTMVNTAVAGTSHMYVVTDIAARDALAPAVVTQALVVNATGDTTVAAGAATYVFNPTGSVWTKISEHESMDLVINWTDIVGRPTSTVAEIDDAVGKTHVHANKSTIDKFSEDAGDIKYNSEFIDPVLRATDW